MERNESARRVSFVGKRYSIAGSFAKDDNAYSLHRTGVGVCLNEMECVVFASSRKFTRGVDPSRGDPVHNFFKFFYTNLALCMLSVHANFGCDQLKDVAAYRKHTDRQTQTDSLSFIY